MAKIIKDNKNKSKEHDNVMEETFQSLENTSHQTESFLEKNAKLLGILFGGILLAAVAYFLYLRFYQEPRNTEATTEIVAADNYFEQDSMSLALNGNPGTYMGYNQIVEEYSGTDVANIAKYKAGIALYKEGQYQEALDKLKSFNADDEGLKAMKNGAIGDSYIQLGDKENALDAYESAVNASELEVLQRIFTKKAVILAMDLGKNDRGLETINSYLNKFPDGDTDGELKKLRERLKYSAQ